MNKNKIISSPEDIDQFNFWHFLRYGQQTRIILETEGLSDNDKREYQVKLNDYYSECGCGMGEIFIGIAIILCIMFFVFRPSRIPVVELNEILLAVLFIIGMALAGKIIGKISAYLKFVKMIRKMESK